MSDQVTTAPTETATEQVNDGTPTESAESNGKLVSDAAKEAMRKLKYRTKDGQEVEVDENEALETWYNRKQHQAAASRTMNEGTAYRKQAMQAFEMLQDQEKFWDVAKKLGHDPRKMSEAFLSRILEDELMDPKDKELRDLRARVERQEKAEKQQIEAEKQQRLQAQTEHLRKEYESDFISTMEKEGVRPSKALVYRMAGHVLAATKIGYKITASDALKMTLEDIAGEQKLIAKDQDGASFIKIFGEETANHIRKYDTSRIKTPGSFLATPEQPETHKQRGEPKKRMSSREWQRHKRGF